MTNPMKNFAFILLLCLCACTTVKRYKRVEKAQDKDGMADINLFTSKLEKSDDNPTTNNLWQLSSRGQEALINVYEKKSKDIDEFKKNISTKYSFADKGKSTLDYTSKDLSLYFTISRTRDYLHMNGESFSLADRLEYIKYTLTIPDSFPLKFIKWNKYVTEYASVDIADMSFNSVFEINASLGQKSSGSEEKKSGTDSTYDLVSQATELTPSLSAKQSFSKTETQKVRYRYLVLNGKMDNDYIEIEQEGMREIDLAGNTIANVSLSFDYVAETVFIADELKKNQTYNAPDKIMLSTTEALVPQIESLDDAKATLRFEYIYRHVTNSKGRKTFFEWDDKVTYYKGTTEKQITLFDKREVAPPFHIIGENGKKDVGVIMYKNEKTGDEGKLTLKGYDEANEFLDWLLNFPVSDWDPKKPIEIGAFKLFFSDGENSVPLSPLEIKGLKGKLIPRLKFE